MFNDALYARLMRMDFKRIGWHSLRKRYKWRFGPNKKKENEERNKSGLSIISHPPPPKYKELLHLAYFLWITVKNTIYDTPKNSVTDLEALISLPALTISSVTLNFYESTPMLCEFMKSIRCYACIRPSGRKL